MSYHTEDIIHRLNRIQGQIEGLKKAITSSEKDCSDILYQIKAARSALRKVGEFYAEASMCQCVDEDCSPTTKKKRITDTLHAILKQ
ncbi:MAG: metal-sensitive transcriptional regulator [Parcubacteria group bacterium]|nr:metal-sensitive transcriptional regulator [Parcubacteria group bacterium]